MSFSDDVVVALDKERDESSKKEYDPPHPACTLCWQWMRELVPATHLAYIRHRDFDLIPKGEVINWAPTCATHAESKMGKHVYKLVREIQ